MVIARLHLLLSISLDWIVLGSVVAFFFFFFKNDTAHC